MTSFPTTAPTPGAAPGHLTEAQIDRAYRLFYGGGMKLGEVAADLGCGIYALSPWLYRAAIRIGDEAVREDRAARSAITEAGQEGRT